VDNDVDFWVIFALSLCSELDPEDCRLTVIAWGRSCIIALWHLIAE